MHVAVLLVLSCVAAAPHNTRAHRSPRHIPRNVTHLAKRFTGKATHYTAGLGACGGLLAIEPAHSRHMEHRLGLHCRA